MQKLIELYEAAVIRRPKWVLAAVLLLVVGLAAGLPRLKLDASADSLTLEHDEALDFYREVNARYQTGDFLVVTYTPEVDLFSDQSLQELEGLRDELAQVEGVEDTLSILDVPLLYSPLPTLSEVTAMDELRTLQSPGVDRQEAKQEFQESPIYRDTLVGPDGQTTAIQLNLPVDNEYLELVQERDQLRLQREEEGLTDQEAARLESVSREFRQYRTEQAQQARQRIEEIRNILADYRNGAEIFLGGPSMMTADMVSFIEDDLVTFGAVVVLFILAMLAIIFRQPRFVVLPFVTCVVVVTMMLGFLGWADWRITVISNNFVSLLLILTLALTIYIVVRYRELHARHPDWNQQQLVSEAARLMARPCLYTVLTTMVAFSSLVVSDIAPVIDFGWMMTIGLSLAYVVVFSFLPAWLVLLNKGEPREKLDQSRAFTEHFARFTEKRGGVVLAVAGVAAAAAAFGIFRLDVENRPIDYFHESTEIYQGLTVIDRQLGGTTPLDIILDAPSEEDPSDADGGDGDPFAEPDSAEPDSGSSAEPESDPFADPANGSDGADEDPFAAEGFEGGDDPDSGDSYWFTSAGLERIETLHDYLESLPEVGRVQSMATAYKVVKDINRGPLNDFELAVMRNQLPQDIEEMLIDPHLSVEPDQTRINLRVQETDPRLERRELPGKIREHATEELGFEDEQIHFSGLLVLYNNMLESLFRSQIVTLGAVFLGIMLMFLLLFRNLLLAVVAIVPNMLAASVVLGSMGIVGISLDLMNIMVAAITVGLGVDHAIHYIHRYRQEFARDRDYLAAMHRSHQSIGRAMYYTAITIIAGFSVLALSEFIPSIYFGLLTSLAMLTALLGSLTLLPRLIVMTRPLGRGAGA